MDSLRWTHLCTLGSRCGALVEGEAGCCSANLAGQEKRPSRGRKGMQGPEFGPGRRGLGDQQHASFWNCKLLRKRGVHSGRDSFNSLRWDCGCAGDKQVGTSRAVRAPRLGFETSIRRVAFLGHPLSVSVREDLGRPARKRFHSWKLCASGDPYEALGVSRTATDKEIKQAYRKLALKFHPDVNKEPGAEKKFMQVKNAYQILTDEKSRAKYDAGKRGSSSRDPFDWQSWQSWQSGGRRSARKPQEEEEFYGFGEFFRDVSVSVEAFFRDLQADDRRQTSKPKSLWEELADIGEEFVEFLEKELNINDATGKDDGASAYEPWKDRQKDNDGRDAKKKSARPTQAPSPEQVEADIEDILADLKKELGMEK